MIKPHGSLIVRTITILLIPYIQIFAAYVLVFGHHSPGGGFQAGVLIGASLILGLLDGSKKELKVFNVQREFLAASFGVLFYISAGLIPIFAGSNFLDYSAIPFLFISDPAARRYFGILWIEAGVALTVAMTLVIIFYTLAFSEIKPVKA